MNLNLRTEERIKKITDVLNQKQPHLTVVLENIHDPHNVSAILRTCDAVGVLEVHLLYTTEQFPEISKASSVSANKWMKLKKHSSYEEFYQKMKSEGFLIAASHLDKYSYLYDELDYTKPIALIFGNEHRGVSDELLKYCDLTFKIPMHGMIQSLNVSVAAAVTLYWAESVLRRSGFYNKRQLDELTFKQIFEEWIQK
ncbi:MAG: RNA methyltransferase [Ignavibacteria bacterium]|jgi:tRNA (guanosine-2'-O-)-methyltransferase|nr:RNA methyltransferase [Ignavibacteria bacterium]MDH7527593.1 RNA methyltransferase [Ignavibacteria bacterium]NPV12236.1 RNA methyltransferase [Ignavibacteria bacterium]